MNTPNKLTVFRMILVPVFLIILLEDFIPFHFYIAAIIFTIASLTDMFDGYLARKNNEVTTFGKFLDPLADKLLVISALVALLQLDRVNAYMVLIIIARELMVTSLRLVASGEGTVIAAGNWGKLKTISQLIAILVLILEAPIFGGNLVGTILIYIATLFTIISGVEYFMAYAKFIDYRK